MTDDGMHICTCMELVHIGIPCRHFFRIWCDTPMARCHIKLIPSRWYNEIRQGNSTLSAMVEQEPFIIQDHIENEDIPDHRFCLGSDFGSILNDITQMEVRLRNQRLFSLMEKKSDLVTSRQVQEDRRTGCVQPRNYRTR